LKARLIAALLAALAPAAHAQFAADQLHLIGAAELRSGVLRLTPARTEVVGAAWLAAKQDVAAGFDTSFRFQLTGQGGLGGGADGFAFVLQNAGPDAIAGRGASGGFAVGDGAGDPSKPGIPRSIAIFFDTFRNPGDPSDNYISICTNGPIGSMRWPPPRLAMSRKLKPRLKDGRVHRAEIHYDPPMLSVSLDDVAVVRAPVDLSTVLDERGAAYVGFTASTGAGFENHDLLDWDFNPRATSAMFIVQSGIDFQKTNCLEGRNLCTPAEPTVEARGPGEFHVVLPANREWGVSIPNPDGRNVEIVEARGVSCGKWISAGEDCSGPDGMQKSAATPALVAPERPPGALVVKSDQGRTWFSVNARKGEFAPNQGFYEFDVRLK
jgi:hypothetical protein